MANFDTYIHHKIGYMMRTSYITDPNSFFNTSLVVLSHPSCVCINDCMLMNASQEEKIIIDLKSIAQDGDNYKNAQ